MCRTAETEDDSMVLKKGGLPNCYINTEDILTHCYILMSSSHTVSVSWHRDHECDRSVSSAQRGGRGKPPEMLI